MTTPPNSNNFIEIGDVCLQNEFDRNEHRIIVNWEDGFRLRNVVAEGTNWGQTTRMPRSDMWEKVS